MRFNALVPELYVVDFQRSLTFYTEILEFALEYQRADPSFAFLSYQGSQVMIELEHEDKDWHTGSLEYPCGRGINFQIRTDNAQKLLERLNVANYPLRRGLKDSYYKVNNTLYGYRQFLVMDPDGYLLRFSQPIEFCYFEQLLHKGM